MGKFKTEPILKKGMGFCFSLLTPHVLHLTVRKVRGTEILIFKNK